MENVLNIVIAVGIMVALAVIFAFVLILCGHLFVVKRDKKIEEVQNLLAGSNCGGCGKAGCAQFAESLVKGESVVTDCNPTSVANKKKIADLLGGGEVGEETVAVVFCNGGDAAIDKFSYQGYGDCITCNSVSGGIKACPTGCIGKKSCVNVCPHDALIMNDEGYAHVIKDKCTSCGVCIETCPKIIIGRIPKKAPVYIACSLHCKGKEVKDLCTHGCIACNICVRSCPNQAITMENDLPVIDYTKCTGCMTCVQKCPTKCIKVHE